MFGSVKKILFILFLAFAANSVASVVSLFGSSASAAPSKKARWNSPAKKSKAGSKKKSKVDSKKKKKSTPRKKYKPAKTKKVTTKASKKTKNKVTKSVNKTAPVVKPPVTKKISKPKKTPAKVLTISEKITDSDIDIPDERPTSPLLFVFVAFVLACVGGMFFLNIRRKQMESARANFQDSTQHNSAFGSRNGTRSFSDTRVPPASRVPDSEGRGDRRTDSSPAGGGGFLNKLSERVSDFLGGASKEAGRSSRGRNHRIDAADSAAGAISQFESDSSGSDSITTIGAVRSAGIKPAAPTEELLSSSATLSPNIGAEPCSFERYVEIQVAAQCWRAQSQSLDPKLRELFSINTEELLQLEFYWKQKISGNINLRKKYQELEPLFSAKYDAA